MTVDDIPAFPGADEELLRRRIAQLEGEVTSLQAREEALRRQLDEREATGATGAGDRASQEARTTALQRQRLHVEQTPLGMIEWDMSFRVTAWNPAAERIFGYSSAEAIGQYVSIILPPALEQAVIDGVWEDLKSRRGGTRSINANCTKDGREVMCDWYNTALVGSDDQVIGVASLVLDITAHHQADKERIALQEQLIATQQAALRELSTPLIPIADGVVVMPLIGAIDSARARLVMEALLSGITAQRAEHAILDITGVRVVDTQVAAALLRVAQAAKLLGAQVILTGIRAEVAQALVTLRADLGGIVTRSNLQTGIAYALEQQKAGGSRAARGGSRTPADE